MASAAVRLKAVVLVLLMVHCSLLLPLFVGGVVWSLFCCAVLSVLSRFAFTSLRKTTLVPLLLLSFCCHVSVPRGAVCDYGISLIYQRAS